MIDNSKSSAMIFPVAGKVLCVGGPLDGATLPFSSHSLRCVTFVGLMSMRHEWYELKTWGRWVNGKAEYKDRWVYMGHGTQDGPLPRHPSA